MADEDDEEDAISLALDGRLEDRSFRGGPRGGFLQMHKESGAHQTLCAFAE